MLEKTYLGFDYGQKKIGVAIANSLTCQARALGIIKTTTKEQRFVQIAKIIREWEPNVLIVGLPLTLDGAEQEASQRSRRFARQLEGRFHLPIVLQDERGSSLEAQALLGKHTEDDAVAAMVILQRYLDNNL